ncbi:MAG: hypothetical protein QM775_34195 [Pirellulales bacterium]
MKAALEGAAGSRPPLQVRLVAGNASVDSPEMYFRVDPDQPPQSLIRPGVQLVFATRRGETSWLPASLAITTTGTNTDYSFNDFDRVRAWLTGTDVADVPNGDRKIAAQWLADQTVALQHARTLNCHGITDGKLQQGYLWQLAGVPIPRRPSGGLDIGTLEVPVWVRYHVVQSPSVPFDPRSRPADLDGPLVVETTSDDGLTAEIEIARAAAAAPRVEYVFRLSRPAGQDRLASITLTADSAELNVRTAPHLHRFAGEMIDPVAPPNLKVFSTVGIEGLKPTGLLFSDRPIDRFTAREIAPLRLVTQPNLDHHFECPGSGDVDTVAAFVPHEDALVQYLTPSRFNVRPVVDPDSGRAVVPRDVNHGLVVWRISKFTIEKPTAGRLARVVPRSGVPLEPRPIDGCLSLAPWVEVRDPVPSATDSRIYNVYHRNLVQEQGEFAAAAEDRALGADPVVVAASVNHFLETVRDAYALGAAAVGNGPADLVNWVPGARLQDPSGTAINPKLDLRIPTRQAAAPERFPRITCATLSGQSLFVPDPQPWLAVDSRWVGDGAAAAPTIELKPAEVETAPGYTRLHDSSGPLLFHQSAVAALADGVDESGASLVVAGQIDGSLLAWRSDDFRPVAHTLGGQTSAVLALSVAELGGSPHILLILAEGKTRLLKWPAGEVVRETPHPRPLDAAAAFAGSAAGDTVWFAALADDSGAIRLLDVASGTVLADLPGNAAQRCAAVELTVVTDGGDPLAAVASVHRDGTARVRLWSTSGTTNLPLTVTDDSGTAARFVSISVTSADPDVEVATGHAVNKVRLWRIHDGAVEAPEPYELTNKNADGDTVVAPVTAVAVRSARAGAKRPPPWAKTCSTFPTKPNRRFRDRRSAVLPCPDFTGAGLPRATAAA